MPRSTIFNEILLPWLILRLIVCMFVLAMFKTLEEIDLMVLVTYAEAKYLNLLICAPWAEGLYSKDVAKRHPHIPKP